MKLCDTSVALLKLALPACDARTVQVPVAISVRLAFNMLHTDWVNREYVAGNPDDAVAVSAKGGVPRARLDSAANEMV